MVTKACFREKHVVPLHLYCSAIYAGKVCGKHISLTLISYQGTADKASLGDTVNIKGDGKNITTSVAGSTITIAMSDTPTFTSVTTGDTVMNTNGVTIANGPSMTASGIDAGSKKITNVADGNVSGTSTDAVNGRQLYEVQQSVTGDESAIHALGSEINTLGTRVNRVGANASAIAALHPLDFDPTDKWDFAAGYGHYRSASAASIGAFYRPNENMMLSVGASVGGGDNMLNAGVSFKLGQGNHISTSRTAMAEKIVSLESDNAALKNQVSDMQKEMELLKQKLGL